MTRNGYITVVICVTALSVGAARSTRITSETTYPASAKPVATATQTKVVEKTVIKYVNTSKQPSGYITEDQCLSLETGMSIRDLLFRFGWPATDDGEQYVGHLVFPLVEDHDRGCTVTIWRNKIDHISLDSA